MDALKSTLDGIALQLISLVVMIALCMAVTALVLKYIPLNKEIKNFLMSLAGLGATYVWFQVTFL
ncbi:membrane protein [Oceanobacillus picturae]|uniref:Membrane protein n=1 Tax=Oceanobacillus picturae TaxID=171693 RepID=A0A0U9H8K2_9BACI|nr:hypothetical protein [Oceanobacillus picturae]GAQ17617.1 membrane protein [Oceanobacillus picturae]